MNKKKLGDKLIAIMLCMAIILSTTIVAAGEEVTPPSGGSETTESTPPESTPSDPPASEPTDPPASEPTDPPSTEPEEPEDPTMHVSDELLRVLKQLEGFNPYAYWDYKQWSIGYGSECPKGMEEYYQKNPISLEYAEELLRGELEFFESELNGFISHFGLKLKQHQYDALVSFSYNIGASWMRSSGKWKSSGNLNSAILSGDTGSHMLYGMMLWSMAGSKPSRHILINRRIIELNIYANGIYAADCFKPEAIPDRYRIAFMDGNGGVVKYEEHGFDAEQPIAIKTEFKSNPTGPDEYGNTVTYVLDGWYTERIGGTKVEQLDSSIPTGMVLYAHWKTPGGTPVEIPQQGGNLKIKVTVTGEGVNVRTGPDTYFHSLYKAYPGEVLEISEVTTRNGLLWGCFDDKWIALKYTDYSDALNTYLPMWGRVTGTTLNVRKGAGTDYALVEGVQKVQGDLLLITEWKCDYSSLWRSTMWGKIDEGWVSLDYVTFDGVLPPDQTVQSIQIAQNPNKLSYLHTLEELDVTGGKLLLTYADGSTATVDITADMVDGFNNANIGTNTLTVSYSGLTTTFDVQIVKAKVIFQLENGTILSEKEYAVGETVEIPADPTKSADETYTYVFTGWDKEVVPCAGNTVYTAQFESVYIDYTVKFLDADGTVISEQTYHWGDAVTAPADPTKPADNTYTYSFAGWDIAVSPVCNGNITYTALYNKAYIDYTITFRYEDGTVIKQYTLHYGDAIEAPAKPVAPEGYQFTGWDQAFTVCQGDATYTAKFALLDYVPGDCNNDGRISDQDAIYLLRYVYFPDRYPIKGSVDYNKDGAITDQDAIYLLRHVYFPERYPLI